MSLIGGGVGCSDVVVLHTLGVGYGVGFGVGHGVGRGVGVV
jgi:hypothetical protein